MPWPMPQAPFLKPSLINTYATYKYVKLGIELGPTLELVTQTHHEVCPMVVWMWAPTRRAPTLEGPSRRACYFPPL
jgi:hypothetical protein